MSLWNQFSWLRVSSLAAKTQITDLKLGTRSKPALELPWWKMGKRVHISDTWLCDMGDRRWTFSLNVGRKCTFCGIDIHIISSDTYTVRTFQPDVKFVYWPLMSFHDCIHNCSGTDSLCLVKNSQIALLHAIEQPAKELWLSPRTSTCAIRTFVWLNTCWWDCLHNSQLSKKKKKYTQTLSFQGIECDSHTVCEHPGCQS